MSYRVRFTTHTGATGYWDGTFATQTGASMSAQTRADVTGYTYTVEEVPDVSTAAVLDASPSVGVMPRRVWHEQRIRALGEAIVRRMGHEYPTVASVFDLAHIRDWAAEIVELCERCGGQQAKPKDAKAPSVPVGASEAPGEGGDSDRKRKGEAAKQEDKP